MSVLDLIICIAVFACYSELVSIRKDFRKFVDRDNLDHETNSVKP